MSKKNKGRRLTNQEIKKHKGEKFTRPAVDQCDELQAQRDALLDALEQVLAHWWNQSGGLPQAPTESPAARAYQHARDAIARVRQTEREE